MRILEGAYILGHDDCDLNELILKTNEIQSISLQENDVRISIQRAFDNDVNCRYMISRKTDEELDHILNKIVSEILKTFPEAKFNYEGRYESDVRETAKTFKETTKKNAYI